MRKACSFLSSGVASACVATGFAEDSIGLLLATPKRFAKASRKQGLFGKKSNEL